MGVPKKTGSSRLPGPIADIWEWQMRGSCRGMNSAFFFHPDQERGPARQRRIDRAKAVCLDCPILKQSRASGARTVWRVGWPERERT